MPSRRRATRIPLLLAAAAAAAFAWLAAGRIEIAAPDRGGAAGRARALAERLIVVDTHIDVPYRLIDQPPPREDVARRTSRGDFDAVRAREGGLDVAWMSIYVPASLQTSGGARAKADELIDLVEGIAAKDPEIFRVVRSADEAEAAARAGRIALPLGIENAAAFEADLANVRHFFDRGVRYATLTHSEDNLIGDSSYSEVEKRAWHGLSPYGREVVAEMNRLGMLVDLSHVSDETFDAALAATEAAPIVSHSSCRHFTPGFERNLDDERIRRLAAKGGVIQINFGSPFLTAAANAWSFAEWQAEQAFKQESGAAEGTPALDAWREEYLAEKPLPRATLADVVAHIEHVIEIAGVGAVGFGSDFDGVGPTLPTELADVSMYPNLIAALLDRGHSEADVAQIAGGNLLRVWRAAEAKAAEIRARRPPASAPPAPEAR